MQKVIFIILPIIFIGCNKDSVEETKRLNSNNPYIKVKKDKQKTTQQERILKLNNTHNMKLEELKSKEAQNLAKLESQKEQKLKEMELKSKEELAKVELQKTKLESNKSITIANIEAKKEIKVKEEESSFKKIAIVIVGLILMFFAILKYLHSLSKRRHEVELKEKELQHEAYMQDIKSKHEHISKMLDIISDEKSDKEIKKSMTKLLERGKSNILEHKRS
jgi:hypothetical protein